MEGIPNMVGDPSAIRIPHGSPEIPVGEYTRYGVATDDDVLDKPFDKKLHTFKGTTQSIVFNQGLLL